MSLLAPVSFADEIAARALNKTRRNERLACASAVNISYPDDPIGFFENVLGWYPWSMQRDISQSVAGNRATFVKKCHASGGTALAARLALWFLYAYPDDSTVVLTTAPTNRQVSELLWRELRDAYHKSLTPLPGRLYDGRNLLNLSGRQYILGFSAKKPGDVPGFHAKRVLIIKDEAAGIDEDIAEALESALAGGDTVRKFEISQPLKAAGSFYNAFNRDRRLYKGGLYTIAAEDTPNFTGEKLIPELINGEWVDERKVKWGIDSAIYGIRVLAKFPPLGAKQLISPDWCEAARFRDPSRVEDGPLVLAVDVAGLGRASTVIYPRAGNYVFTPEEIQHADPMQVAGHVVQCINAWHPRVVAIDATGIGNGTYARLVELKIPGVLIVPINAGARADNVKDYANLGTELWATFAARLRDNEIAGDIDDDTTADLVQALAWPRSDGRLIVDKMGTTEHSPDRGDALVYTEFANRALRIGRGTISGERL